MIVRILNDAQYRLDDGQHGELDRLDDEVVAAVDAGDEAGYRERFDALLAFVRRGEPVGDDDLDVSDFIIPPEDLTFAEAGQEFTGEGLIPDAPV